MPITKNNFNEEILTLIQDGTETSLVFDQNEHNDSTGNHYVRMSVFEEDGKLLLVFAA